MNYKIILTAILCITLQSLCISQNKQTLPTDPDLVSGTLSNGLSYYIKKNTTSADKAEIRLIIDAGSIQEGKDQIGATELIKRLSYQGTANFSAEEIQQFLSSTDNPVEASHSFKKSFQKTIHELSLPARDLSKGLSLLNDWAAHINFTPAIIEQERKLLQDIFQSEDFLFKHKAYALSPDNLYQSVLTDKLPNTREKQQISKDNKALQKFYDDWYRPNLMSIVIVGDVEPEQAKEMVRAQFSDLTARGSNKKPTQFIIPTQDQSLITFAVGQITKKDRIDLNFRYPHPSLNSYKDYKEKLIGNLLHILYGLRINDKYHSGNSNLLFTAGTQKNYNRLETGPGCRSTIEEGQLENGLRLLMAEYYRGANTGFTKDELDRAKDVLGIDFQMVPNPPIPNKEASGITSKILRGDQLMSASQTLMVTNEITNQITLQEINLAARKYMTKENLCLVFKSPKESDLSTEEVRQIIEEFSNRSYKPYIYVRKE